MNYPHSATLTHPHRGFTLIEMVAVLAIASILTAGALPAFEAIGMRMNLSSFSNGFLSQLHLARSEAIKRSTRVVVCNSANGTSCASSGGWEQGTIVFEDSNNNGLREAGEFLIERGGGLPAGYRFAGNQHVGRYISFTPMGATRMISGGFQAGTLTLCSRSNEPVPARQVVISAVGRPRVQKTTVTQCI
jgi:type IV fimbrial biogenesis protein FimT